MSWLGFGRTDAWGKGQRSIAASVILSLAKNDLSANALFHVAESDLPHCPACSK